jgi:RND family efflux transporter MFP subunit
VQAARTAMQLAERNAERAEELAKRGVLTEANLDEARTRAASAREQYASARNGARAALSSLEAARVALQQARTSTSEATVRAPFAGEIADRMVSVGEFVSPQTPLVNLVRTDPLRIELEVPQRELRAVQPGLEVEVAVDAVPDRRFEGTVRYVSAAVGRNSRTLTVEAVIPNPDRILRPGLFATARLLTGGDETVSVVPAAALHTSAGVSRVFSVEDGTIHERVVTVGDRIGDEVVLTGGVEGGKMVAVDHLDELADGVAVRVDATVAKKDD